MLQRWLKKPSRHCQEAMGFWMWFVRPGLRRNKRLATQGASQEARLEAPELLGASQRRACHKAAAQEEGVQK